MTTRPVPQPRCDRCGAVVTTCSATTEHKLCKPCHDDWLAWLSTEDRRVRIALDAPDARDHEIVVDLLSHAVSASPTSVVAAPTHVTPPPFPPRPSQTFENEFVAAKQQQDPSCAVHGVVAVFEHEWYRMSNWTDKICFSDQFVYWCARQIAYPRGDGVEDRQLAVTHRDVLKALCRYGACPSAWWAERFGASAIEPPADRFALALGWRVKRYGQPAETLLKTLLQIHVAVACVVEQYTSWTAPEMWSPDGGITPAQRTTLLPPSQAGTLVGYHSVCLAGFNDDRECWRIRNSAGSEWADRGFAWLPYEYAIRDPWTISHVKEEI